MSDNETYNGWTNRETWAFMLHVSNEQGLYEMTKETARAALSAPSVRADDSEDVLNFVVGTYVVDHVRETLEGLFDSMGGNVTQTDTWAMYAEVGSWWRVDRTEVGAAVRESLED